MKNKKSNRKNKLKRGCYKKEIRKMRRYGWEPAGSAAMDNSGQALLTVAAASVPGMQVEGITVLETEVMKSSEDIYNIFEIKCVCWVCRVPYYSSKKNYLESTRNVTPPVLGKYNTNMQSVETELVGTIGENPQMTTYNYYEL